MFNCEKYFEADFIRIERLTKLIGIPFFTIITVLFITDFPVQKEFRHFLYHLVTAFVGVFSIWHFVRLTYIFSIKHSKLPFKTRMALQLLITCTVSILIILLLHFIWNKFHFDGDDCFCGDEEINQNIKNLILVAIIFTFLLNALYEGFYLFLRLSATALERERYKKESIEAQYQNLTSRLNPHFLFNSLNTLTTIVEEDSKKAVSYIKELSIVYRYVLNSEKSTWVDLPSEIKFTNSYITLLKMRFEENLKLNLDICEKHQLFYILPLTIQLLIENAVKHNEISTSHPLEVKIYCTDEYLIVTNNKQKRQIMPSSTKVGLQNIKDRYWFLVSKEVIVEDTDTTFTVKIPLVKLNV